MYVSQCVHMGVSKVYIHLFKGRRKVMETSVRDNLWLTRQIWFEAAKLNFILKFVPFRPFMSVHLEKGDIYYSLSSEKSVQFDVFSSIIALDLDNENLGV